MDTGLLPFASSQNLSPPNSWNVTDSQACFTHERGCLQCFAISPNRNVSLTPLHSDATDTTLTRSSLSNGHILGQVDQKFIACLLDTTTAPGKRTVVLIDQHAADERVSVERILRDLCEGFAENTMDITQLTNVELMSVLTRAEGELLARPETLDIFRRWGIQLVVPEAQGDYVQVAVRTVPTAFVLRLGRKEATEMTRLIKLYLPILKSSLGELETLLAEEDISELDWGRIMRWMPKEMLELANSKACRGKSSYLSGIRLS